LHPLARSEKGVVDQKVEEDNSLDIFKIVNTIELTTKLTYKELLILRHYQMDVKNIKCPLQWQENHESMFPIVGGFARQILRIN
jgi:hypothetical protein